MFFIDPVPNFNSQDLDLFFRGNSETCGSWSLQQIPKWHQVFFDNFDFPSCSLFLFVCFKVQEWILVLQLYHTWYCECRPLADSKPLQRGYPGCRWVPKCLSARSPITEFLHLFIVALVVTQVLSWTFLMWLLFLVLNHHTRFSFHPQRFTGGLWGQGGGLFFCPEQRRGYSLPHPARVYPLSGWKPSYLFPLAGTKDRAVSLPVSPHDTRHRSLPLPAGFISVWWLPLTAWSAA